MGEGPPGGPTPLDSQIHSASHFFASLLGDPSAATATCGFPQIVGANTQTATLGGTSFRSSRLDRNVRGLPSLISCSPNPRLPAAANKKPGKADEQAIQPFL